MNKVKQLRRILAEGNVDHEKAIFKEPSIKAACAYCVLNRLSTQLYGNLIERYIENKFGYTCVADVGDCRAKVGNIEIKTSFGGNKLGRSWTFSGIRPRKRMGTFILVAYRLTKKNANKLGHVFIFKLNRRQMIRFLLKFGHYSRESVKKNGPINHKSVAGGRHAYGLRVSFGSKKWKALLPYRIGANKLRALS
jgi:hypothetical protein